MATDFKCLLYVQPGEFKYAQSTVCVDIHLNKFNAFENLNKYHISLYQQTRAKISTNDSGQFMLLPPTSNPEPRDHERWQGSVGRW